MSSAGTEDEKIATHLSAFWGVKINPPTGTSGESAPGNPQFHIAANLPRTTAQATSDKMNEQFKAAAIQVIALPSRSDLDSHGIDLMFFADKRTVLQQAEARPLPGSLVPILDDAKKAAASVRPATPPRRIFTSLRRALGLE